MGAAWGCAPDGACTALLPELASIELFTAVAVVCWLLAAGVGCVPPVCALAAVLAAPFWGVVLTRVAVALVLAEVLVASGVCCKTVTVVDEPAGNSWFSCWLNAVGVWPVVGTGVAGTRVVFDAGLGGV